MANKDWFEPNAISQVEANVPADEFENTIRKFGVGFACEWFGYEFDGKFASDTVNELCVRSGLTPPFYIDDKGDI